MWRRCEEDEGEEGEGGLEQTERDHKEKRERKVWKEEEEEMCQEEVEEGEVKTKQRKFVCSTSCFLSELPLTVDHTFNRKLMWPETTAEI